MSDSTTICSFRKNALEEVRAALTRYRGYHLIDLRIWTEKKTGEFVATKKGLSLKVELLPELKRAVTALEIELIRRGLLETEET